MKGFLSLLLCVLLSFSTLGCAAGQKTDVVGWQEISQMESSTDSPFSAFVFDYSDDRVDQNAEQSYQSITIAFTNSQAKVFSSTGSEVILAWSQNSKWYKVPCSKHPKADPAQYAIRLDGCSMSSYVYNLTDYYDYLPKGSYRLLIPLLSSVGEKQQIFVSFMIS